MNIKILGSGTSTGIPLVACNCQVCTSSNTKNKRLRSSFFIKDKEILVDTGPDLRTQLLSNHIKDINLIVITHEHADHLNGLDDIRPINFIKNKSIDLVASNFTVKKIKRNFSYIFKKRNIGGGVPRLKIHQFSFNKNIVSKKVKGNSFHFFKLPHGAIFTTGFMLEKFAYIPDCHQIPSDVVDFLKKQKLKLLLINCLQYHPHSSQLNISKAFEYILAINAKKSGLIHIGHHLEHHELLKYCRKFKNVIPTYDGLELHI